MNKWIESKKLQIEKEREIKRLQLEARERLVKEAEQDKLNPSPDVPITSKKYLIS